MAEKPTQRADGLKEEQRSMTGALAQAAVTGVTSGAAAAYVNQKLSKPKTKPKKKS